jgi:hypothetical protein
MAYPERLSLGIWSDLLICCNQFNCPTYKWTEPMPAIRREKTASLADMTPIRQLKAKIPIPLGYGQALDAVSIPLPGFWEHATNPRMTDSNPRTEYIWPPIEACMPRGYRYTKRLTCTYWLKLGHAIYFHMLKLPPPIPKAEKPKITQVNRPGTTPIRYH